jgi:hypothetical protein
MNYALLLAEVTQDPLALGYMDLLPDSPGGVVQLLNRVDQTMTKPRFITARTALAELGVPGAVIMEKLEAFAAQPAFADLQVEGLRIATRWAMRFVMSDGEGLDVGHPNTRLMLQTLAVVGAISEDEASALQSLATQPASRAEVVLGKGVHVTEEDLRIALSTQE